LHGALLAAAQSETDSEATVRAIRSKLEHSPGARVGGCALVSDRVERRKRRRHGQALMLGMAGLAAAALVALFRSGSPPPESQPASVFEVIAGRGYVHGREGQAAAAGRTGFRAGDWLSTSGRDGHARLAHPDGTAFELQGDTVAAQRGSGPAHQLFLASGRLTARSGSATAVLSLVTPHAMVTGRGRLALDVSNGATRLEVQQGWARVVAVGSVGVVEVNEGQFALARAGMVTSLGAVAPSRRVLLLVGPDEARRPLPDGALQAADEQLAGRLERLGFTVVVSRVNEASIDEAGRVSLVVLSSTVAVWRLGSALTDLPVPMVVLEPAAFNQLGLTGSRWMIDMGSSSERDELVIRRPEHPLAAGLSGSVRVLAHPQILSWGLPAPEAVVIASYAGAAPDVAVIFAYEDGAVMAGGTAPARRVGLFLNDGRAVKSLNEQGWRLFDAAVAWAAVVAH